MTKKLKYKFHKAKHCHLLGDIPLHGTTTVLGIISKPQLIPWAARMATENIKSQWKIGKAYTAEERDAILESGRTAHSSKKTSAGNIGTTVHEAIEKWIKAGCPNEMPMSTFCGEDVQVTKMFINFIEWVLQENVEFISSEKNVYSEKHWFGGITDFVCIIDGKRYIGDIKTSSGIYPEYWLQMAAYDIALQEMGEMPASGYVIVNLKKDGKVQIQKTKETFIYKKGFLSALELYKIMKKIS